MTSDSESGGLFGEETASDSAQADAGDLFASEPAGLELPDTPLEPEAAVSQPLISPEESEAIIQAMRAGSIAPASLSPPAPSVAQAEVEGFRLGAPDALLRRAITRAERVADVMADVIVGALLEQVVVVADAEPLEPSVDSVEATFEPYVATGTAWDVAPRGHARPWATVVLGGSFADVVLARRLGAEGAVAKPGARSRAMSALGRRVLAPIAEACVSAVAAELVPELAGAALVPAGSGEARIPMDAPCLRVAVRVRLGEVEDDALVVLYDDAIASRAPAAAQSESARRMQNGLHDVDVELTATLGQTHVSVRELLALEVGSVVRLSGTPERPVVVSCSGTPVLSGMPIVHQGNLAIEVIT